MDFSKILIFSPIFLFSSSKWTSASGSPVWCAGGLTTAPWTGRPPCWSTWRLPRTWTCTASTTSPSATRRAPNCSWAWTPSGWTSTRRPTSSTPKWASPGAKSATSPSTTRSSWSSRGTRSPRFVGVLIKLNFKKLPKFF